MIDGAHLFEAAGFLDGVALFFLLLIGNVSFTVDDFLAF